ncbi:hypothetical protein GOV07_00330 [Candidatus Woesearchaeota archaeon]|nr:hypothetical protein [Candidatus Woesearchaeota archaeon]
MNINRTFAITTITTIALLLVGVVRGENLFSAVLIAAALIGTCWWFSLKGKAATGTVIASIILIHLHAVGAGFALYPMSFVGTTYDTYMHILAAFVLTLLAVDYFKKTKYKKHAFLLSGLLVFGLGIGVEIVELLSAYISGFDASCWNSCCFYWKDTLKDLFNDALGIVLALLARKR